MFDFKMGSPRSGKAMAWNAEARVNWVWNALTVPLTIPEVRLTRTLGCLKAIQNIAQTESRQVQPTRERLSSWIELNKQTSTLVDLLAEPAKRTSTLQGSYLLF